GVEGRFTRAFLNPPFAQEGEPERDFINASMDALQPEGKHTAVVYAGIFADDEHKIWRRDFLRKHSLLAMISLPEDLFYPTAAPTSIVVAQAHVPQSDDASILMARVWNDGFEKLKGRRVERPGSQLLEVKQAFANLLAGQPVSSDLVTTVLGSDVKGGAEWSPQQWLPQPHVSLAEMGGQQQLVIRSIYQAVAHFPDLADEALDAFGDAWSGQPDLPTGIRGAVTDFFEVRNGRSTGEKNYVDGPCPYVSSGDASNSVVRLVAPVGDERFDDGAITVTAFGTAAVQPWPFMGRGNGGSAVRVLTPKYNMSFREIVWFAAQINVQKWRFFYARMSIKSRLERLVIESPPERLPDSGASIAGNIRTFRDTLDAFSGVSIAPGPSATP
ncbi:MAG TPA: N-6 DNA methylase, partial [Thermomicrobiales bacterium]|nr:N-6 DNA methylase [Thermomicrobiales bacterium]